MDNNTLAEMRQLVQDDLTVNSSSTLFPEALIDRTLNRAKRKAEGLFRWAEKEDAKETNAQANVEYYDYPQNWEPDSVWKITVDGTDYGSPLDFKDYLYEKENDIPSGRTTMWSSQWRRFFLYPTPTVSGTSNICIWGQKVTDPLENDTDTTIFSYSMPECNEAIVLEAVAMLKSKGEEEQAGTFRSMEAKGILTVAWNKNKQNKTKYHKTREMFDVPDLFATPQSKQRTGDF